MLALQKTLDSPWEIARVSLRQDLDTIQTVLNRRWSQTFGTSNTLSPTSGGTGAGTFTEGSVLFAGPRGAYAQNNAAFFWDNTNRFLILTPGNAPPNNVVEIRGSGGVLAFKDAANSVQHGFIGSLSSPVSAMVIGASNGEPLVVAQNGSTVNFGSYSANHPSLQWDSTTLYVKVYNVASHYNFSAKDLIANADGLGIITLGGLDADRSYGGLWLAQATPSFSNYTFLGHGGAANQTFLNVNASGGGTGDIECRVDNNTRFTVGAKGISINLTSNTAPSHPLHVFALDKTTELLRLIDAGLLGIGLTPTALLHIKAGTATANTAPLKFTSGVSLTTAEAGAVEFTTDTFFATITTGAARKGIVLDDGARLTSGKYPKASTNGRLIDGPTPLAGTKVYWVSDTSGGAVTRKLTFTDGILTAET